MGRVSQGFDLVGACRRQRCRHAGVVQPAQAQAAAAHFKALRPVPPSRKTGWSLSLGEAVAGVVAEVEKEEEEEEAVVVAVVMQMV